jgi:hypothetical protein
LNIHLGHFRQKGLQTISKGDAVFLSSRSNGYKMDAICLIDLANLLCFAFDQLFSIIKSTTGMQFLTLIFALAVATSGGLSSAGAAAVVTIKCNGTGTVGGFGVGSISENPMGVFYAPGDTPGVTYTSAALACQDACNGQLG